MSRPTSEVNYLQVMLTISASIKANKICNHLPLGQGISRTSLEQSVGEVIGVVLL